MSSRHPATVLLFLFVALVVACSAFQVTVPSSAVRKSPVSSRPVGHIVLMAEASDSDDSDSTSATEDSESTTTAIEAPTVESIEVESLKFESSEIETPQYDRMDWFTVAFGVYVAFALADTFFHILPNKSYVQMAKDVFTSN